MSNPAMGAFRVAALFVRGVVAGLAVHKPILAILRNSEIRWAASNCAFMSGVVFLGSLVAYDAVAAPALRRVFGSGRPEFVASVLYQFLWLWPVYMIGYFLSSTWFSKIVRECLAPSSASGADSLQQGSAKSGAAASGISWISDSTYKTMLYCSCVAISMAVSYVPVVGTALSFAVSALIYTFLCVDTKWMVQSPGARLSRRIVHFENRWAFFLGFGTPFTLTCFFFPLLVNCGLYSLLFPAFLIMAAETETKGYSGPLLHVFRPAIMINEFSSRMFVRVFAGAMPAPSAVAPASPKKPSVDESKKTE